MKFWLKLIFNKNIMSIWNKIYQAYKDKNCSKLKNLFLNLTQEDKNSPYFSEYWSLYVKQCWEKNEKWKISFKWKNIKCPHCGASITKSVYNNESIKRFLQNGKKWEIDLICNYCGTKFTWSGRKFKSLFTDYAIWKEVEISGKKYKIAWWVKYKGKYYEEWEVGRLTYIEWLAYDEKWELFYISESIAIDYEWETYKDIEISKKVNFPFVIKEYNSSSIETDDWNFWVSESDEVEVIAVSWEVNKAYKIWEKVKLYAFSNYNLEEEKWTNNIERNLYQNVYYEDNNNSIFWSSGSNLKEKIWENGGILLIVWYVLFAIFPIILILLLVIVVIYYFLPNKYKDFVVQNIWQLFFMKK